MERLQFRALYRQFLFRMVDLELLSSSAQGDIHRLLGQFAALLITLSASLGLLILVGGDGRGTPMVRMLAAWATEHFLIALTILVVGLFAVVSWESLFPDRRDVLVLAPLPVRARTLFLAKVAAAGAALGISVATINAFTGLTAPLVFGSSPVLSTSLLNPLRQTNAILATARLFGVYWLTILAAGVFTFSTVITIQGVAQLLPRQKFLRISALLQIAAFIAVITMFFTQFPFAPLEELASPQDRQLLPWLPSYWFFGMLQQLNGSAVFSSGPEMLTVFARRAWIGLGASVAGAIASYLICYFRTLRMIAEQPDILPSRVALRWLPRFGEALPTAIAHFSIRTLLRSRRHRVTISFYLGIALAIVLFLIKNPDLHQLAIADLWHEPSPPMLAATILLLGSAVIGVRVAFGIPVDLRANWIFRMAPVERGQVSLVSARRSLLALSVVPAWLASAALLLWLWPWRAAAEHLAVLALVGTAIAEACLLNFRKIPFTCSFLPGKAHFDMAVLAYLGAAFLISGGVPWEMSGLREDPGTLVVILGYLVAAVLVLRWRTAALARSPERSLEFEETREPVIMALGLTRDGAAVGSR